MSFQKAQTKITERIWTSLEIRGYLHNPLSRDHRFRWLRVAEANLQAATHQHEQGNLDRYLDHLVSAAATLQALIALEAENESTTPES